MAKQLVKKGDTSRIEYIFVQNSSSTTGAGLTGLVFNSSGLTAYYVRTQGSATAITLATQTVTGAFSSGGFVEVDATNMPGIYRVDIPDAVFATGVDKAALLLKGATNMAPVALEYQLVDFDPEDAAGLGLSRVDVAISTRNATAPLDAAGTRAAVGLAAANLDTQLTAIDDFLDTEIAAILAAVDTEVAAIKAKTDNLPATPAATGDTMTLTAAYDFAKGTVAATEAYAADGAAATPAQLLYMIYALLGEKSVAATTMTVKKLDGTTTAMTYTLNDGTNPTSITRAT